MAFAMRNAAEENNAHIAKDVRAGSKMSLLQQGSKRRALNDIGNSLGLRSAKDNGADAVMKPATRASAAVAAPAVGPAPVPPAPVPVLSRVSTRSQTAALRNGTSTSSAMLEPCPSQASSVTVVKSRRSSRPFTASLPGSPVVDIDKSDRNDPLAASEYVSDIFSWHRNAERRFAAKCDYMSRQTDVNDKMRAILLDWLVEVHINFKLLPESLYLTVNLIDRFLELKQVTRKHLQLVGVTAMLIASKYEEIWSPEVKDFVHITDKAYTRQQILSMEKLMLNTLKFNLTVPTPHKFLTRFLKAAGVEKDKELCTLATYLVELSLQEYHMLKFSYSQIACAAVYTAMRAGATSCSLPMSFPRALAGHSGYCEHEVLPVASALVDLMLKAKENTLTAVYKKYSASKHLSVAHRAAPTKIREEAGNAMCTEP